MDGFIGVNCWFWCNPGDVPTRFIPFCFGTMFEEYSMFRCSVGLTNGVAVDNGADTSKWKCAESANANGNNHNNSDIEIRLTWSIPVIEFKYTSITTMTIELERGVAILDDLLVGLSRLTCCYWHCYWPSLSHSQTHNVCVCGRMQYTFYDWTSSPSILSCFTGIAHANVSLTTEGANLLNIEFEYTKQMNRKTKYLSVLKASLRCIMLQNVTN